MCASVTRIGPIDVSNPNQARDFAVGQAFDDARLSVTRSEALITQANAAIELIDVSLDKARLQAPFNARVGAQTIDEGSTLSSGVTVALLYALDEPTVRIGLPVESVRLLGVRSDHTIEIGGVEYPGSVVSTRGDLSARTRTVDVRLQLDTTGLPRPVVGQTANMHLQQRIADLVYQIPISALTEGEAGLWSLLLSIPDELDATIGRVVREHIDIVYTDGEHAIVKGELLPKGRIISSGTHRVVPGQRVLVKAVKP